jgi:hypothetical protein
LDSTFFGLTQNYKIGVYQELFDLVYYGQGGFTYTDVSNMPIHIRRFFIKRIEQDLKKKQKAEQKASKAAQSKSRVTAPKFRR